MMLDFAAASIFSVVGGRTDRLSVIGESGGAGVSWSIAELARLSGVTSRTLRHYDEIGLLLPAAVRSNGYRYYEQDELLRLQQILLLRELDLGLGEIAAILDEQRDRVQALREHRQRLLDERDRLTRLARTVSATIDELEGNEGEPGMSMISRPENLFDGFDPTEYDAEARERWPQQWEQSKRFTDTLSAQDTERLQREQTAAMIRMAEHQTAGTDVADPGVQAEIEAAYLALCQLWTPNALAFKNLGQMYVDDPRFAATYDAIKPGLAEYYRDAMAVYADTQLN